MNPPAMRLATALAVILLPALATAQALKPSAYGFATFDTDVAICSKNEPGRRTEFSRRLDPVRACGRVDTKLATEIRASAAYRQEVRRQLAAAASEGGSRAQTTIYCDTALANLEQFCQRNMGSGKGR